MKNEDIINLLDRAYEEISFGLARSSDRYWETFVFPRNTTELSPYKYYCKNVAPETVQLLDDIYAEIAKLENEE